MVVCDKLKFRWLKGYNHNSSYYHQQIWSIHLFPLLSYFPWLCAWGACTVSAYYTTSSSSLCRRIWMNENYKMLVRYVSIKRVSKMKSIICHVLYGAVYIQLNHFFHDDCENTCTFIVIIKSEVWPICHCLGFGMQQWYALYVCLYSYGLNLIPAWMINHMHYKVWDGITNPISNFNGSTVEVWEWISNFIL